jgi:hypothetical protein
MLSTHAPALLQSWEVNPLHLRVPGLQEPPQAATVPGTQTDGHATPFQVPVPSHVSSEFPVHRVWFGLHTPVHAPPLHTKGHTVPFDQVPPLQVCGVLPMHCASPGLQAAHCPRLQTGTQAEPRLVHVPSAPHTCGWLPLHCVAPGVHVPEQALF